MVLVKANSKLKVLLCKQPEIQNELTRIREKQTASKHTAVTHSTAGFAAGGREGGRPVLGGGTGVFERGVWLS